MRRRTFLPFCLAVGSAIPAWAAADDDAQRSIERWLALVDAKSYAESWQQAGARFRAAITSDQWARSADAVRAPLGPLRKRVVSASRSATSLPGMPDGRYVVVQYDAVFDNKASGVETVTAGLEPDGTWKVIGYFVK